MSVIDTIRYLKKNKEQKYVERVSRNESFISKEEDIQKVLEMYQNPLNNKNVILAIYSRIKESSLHFIGYSKLIILVYRIITVDQNNILLESLRGNLNVFENNIPIDSEEEQFRETCFFRLSVTLSKMIDWVSYFYSNFNILFDKDIEIMEFLYQKRRKTTLLICEKMIEMFLDFNIVDWNCTGNYITTLNYQMADILLSIYAKVFCGLFKYISAIIQHILLFVPEDTDRVIRILELFNKVFESFLCCIRSKEVQSRFIDLPKIELIPLEEIIQIIHATLKHNSVDKESRTFSEIALKLMKYKVLSNKVNSELVRFTHRIVSTLVSSRIESHSSSTSSLKSNTPKEMKISFIYSSKQCSRTNTPMSVLQNHEIFKTPRRIPSPMERYDIFIPSDYIIPKPIKKVSTNLFEEEEDLEFVL
ncbi:hypothetical protein EHI8A_116420 [Entamoeba histolytica HM-1:IMSS-B]|uniref:ENTH domain-containing protein n=6 Tax=Entamoeba histolytica TaxID=5759 RepID=C4LW63_ENTH1|nr:hypothetical protein EHI_142180 [Entamoeba histolytica HM-1:IMSS]EMD48811.1 Hypothetical protein EHI5A_076890 [Entamoeba histolytica KU27]EMH76722.1 hypothetical protein EHI8A_116420 [Entamoeba histolytica HM-1:IMSS-B]EMS17578.1 hypothetical protein KM1_092260 [Entamoeba histolytica HM-3:IMSS]ENY64433.1 hypothetical protein EHI7A_048210 [Entamoeba histolytica HM-1:IMSS-A]GAT92936.1 hypothetical protein CL6EHI_142180 [Entamoeba histolytica]|eukprot:XP_656093.1 hypothetical protein EHI_142180 [Entamoeba histolytica HM-1:IMSS]